MARSLVASDNFDRANGPVGANWTYIRPTTFQVEPPEVTSLKVGARASAGNFQVIRWNGAGTFADDQYAKLKIISMFTAGGNAKRVGVVVRCGAGTNGSSTYYMLQIRDNATSGGLQFTVVTRVVNNVFVNVDSRNFNWAHNDTLSLEVEGTSPVTLRVYKNDVLQYTVTDTDPTAIQTGKPGMLIAGNTVTEVTADDWEAGSLVVVDTTPPTLSSPTGSATGTTTATVGVTTTGDANGTLYVVLTTTSLAPNALAIRNGQNASGIATINANQAITSTGAKTFDLTGLSPNTQYWAHFTHRDAAGNDSAVATTASSFTTDPLDTTAPTLTSPNATPTGTTTASAQVSTSETGGNMFIVVTTNTSTPTAAQVKLGQNQAGAAGTFATNVGVSASQVSFNVTGLTASTDYATFFVHRDAAGNDSAVAAATVFTTGSGVGAGAFIVNCVGF